MKTVKIEVKIRSRETDYNLHIGYNIFNCIKDFLNKNYSSKRPVIICDNNIKNIYGKKILENLGLNKDDLISFPKGENSKSTAMKEKIETILLQKKIDRNSVFLTLGGGVTGDLGGFVAATYYRGVPFIQIPTSLLAMVDSSIGGKVAVNHKIGKNLIGAFYQPEAVFIDISLLDTLPQNQLINGLAEVIKTALIKDSFFFDFLIKNRDNILKRDPVTLQKIIRRTCEIKSEIVSLDEKEGGLRKILNYGHTIGHAIEKLSNYKILHGYSVSIGMSIENYISEKIGLLGNAECKRIDTFLSDCNLPIKVPKTISSDAVINKLKYDKKSLKGIPRFSILNKIGNSLFDVEVEPDIIIHSINYCKNRK